MGVVENGNDGGESASASSAPPIYPRRFPLLLPNIAAAILANQPCFPRATGAGGLDANGSSFPCPVGFIRPVLWS